MKKKKSLGVFPVVDQISVFAFMAMPVHKKIRFPERESELDGVGVLDESGGLEVFGDRTYGTFTEEQLRRLRRRKVPFTTLDE